MKHFILLTAVFVTAASAVHAQAPEVSIEPGPPIPVVGRVLSPFHFEKRVVAPAKLTNSPRLESLVRGGNLYLSVQDVIALVLENNLDIAIQRYGPFLASEVVRRTKGGGYLRAVDTALLPGPTSVSLAGVSVNASGLAGGAGISSGGGIVSQIGPVPPSLDPFVYFNAQYGHTTTPLTNTLLNQTTSLRNDYRQYVAQYGQSFLTGTSGTVTFYTYDSKLNSPTPLENPAIQGYLDFYLTQNLLQGFKISVNNRDIRVARNNEKVSLLQLKRQVMTTVAAVLNLYWDLVSFDEDLRIKQEQIATAQKLYEDNQYKVKLGTLSAIEITRAAAALSSSKQDLLISQTNVAQQETVLKNALSRNGVESPWLDEVHIVPLDRIEVPKNEDLPPQSELIAEALAKSPEIAQTDVNIDSSRILLQGDRNGMLPTLQAFVDLTNNGLAGAPNPLYNGCCGEPVPYFFGGSGNLLGQVFRRNFPNYSAGLSLNIPFRNRVAQADYTTDQLTLRQSELQLQRAKNQIRVNVKNAIIGLQQARARYQTAVDTRQLAEQNLEAEQKRFQYGAVSDTSLVIAAQNDLAADQSAEVQAMANYTHAKIAFDDAIGATLEINHISMQEAVAGRVARTSMLPANLPPAAKQ